MKSNFCNIAYIAPKVYYSSMTDIVSGIREQAKQLKINIFHFIGPTTTWSKKLIKQSNFIYKLINPNHLAGMICWTSQLILNEGAIFDVEKLLIEFPQIPFISIGKQIGNYPNIRMDNTGGVQQLMHHLIHDHNIRKIAFIKGPDYHPYAVERFEGYKDGLRLANIPFQKKLVSFSTHGQGFYEKDGAAAISFFIDKRKLQPGIDFQAIASASDSLSLGAVNELKSRGYHIPRDVAVVGFNNKEESILASPSITTIDPNFRGIGSLAVDKMHDLINHKNCEKSLFPSPKMVIRHSCGCNQIDYHITIRESKNKNLEVLEKTLLSKTPEITELGIQIINDASMPVKTWMSSMYTKFINELFDNITGEFIDYLEKVLDQVIDNKKSILYGEI